MIFIFTVGVLLGVFLRVYKVTSYIKKTFYEDDNYKISLEEVDGYLMIHVAIYEFSKAILKELKHHWAVIRERAYASGYDKIYTYSQEERMFKFFPNATKLGEVEKDGITYGVWQWDLK